METLLMRRTLLRATEPRALGALLLALCVGPGAQADDSAGGDSKGMTGDWGGLRTALLERGVEVEMSYTGESASNLRGGYDRSHATRYADEFSLGTQFDLEKLLGWSDAEFGVQVVNRNGHSLTRERLADPRGTPFADTQEIFGASSVTRLSALWLSKGWLDDQFNLKLGRFAFGDEFALEDCHFQNQALCDSQIGNFVDSVYNGPVSTWAARLKWHLGEQWAAQVGAFAVNPSYLENDNGFKLNGSGTDGALLPAELIWSPKLAGLPGEYHAGYYYSTAPVDDLFKDADDLPAALSGEEVRRDSSRHGWWLTAKQQLTRVDGDLKRGLVLYANVSAFDQATTPVKGLQKLGLVYLGPFAARPDDTLGLAVVRLQASKQWLRNARATNAAGGFGYDDEDYLPEQHSELDIELNYSIQATDWLSLRPNLQYVRTPGGVREVQNAVVAGMMLESKF
jgi:porin